MLRKSFPVLFATAAVPLALAGAWFWTQADAARRVSLQLHQEVAGFAATALARHLEVLEGRLEFLRQLYPDLASGAPSQAAVERVRKALKLNPDFLGLVLVDRNGHELRRWANSPLMRNFDPLRRAAQPLLGRAAESGRPAVALAAVAQSPSAVSVQPIGRDRLVCVAVSLEGLVNELSRHRLGAGGLPALATADGRLLPVPGAALPRVDPAFLAKLLAGGDRGWSDRIPAPEGPYLGMYERVPSASLTDWYALTLQPASELGLNGARALLIVGAFAVLAASLALFGGFLLAAPWSEAVANASRAIEALGRGEEPIERALPPGSLLEGLRAPIALAARALRERESRTGSRAAEERSTLERIVRHLPDGVIVTNFRWEVLSINPPALAAFGIKAGEAASRPLFELIRAERLRASIQQLLESRGRVAVVEVPMEGPGGSEVRFYETKATVLDSGEPREPGMLLTLRDVTAERELAKLKEEFFHSVAHDLRAPIFAIQGYLRLLEKALEPEPPLKGYLEACHQSCDKLTLFVQDILDSAKLEAGQLKLGVSALEPGPFLGRVQRIFGGLAAEKGISLEVKLGDGLPPAFDGDERLLERVLGNLVSNAVKVTGRGDRITLGAGRAGPDQLDFSVADTGPGIPKDKLGFVFEKFSQLGGAKPGGFGLGLHICRMIVELHRGKIWAESDGGRGTQVVFRVPIKQVLRYTPMTEASPAARGATLEGTA